jgi:putative protease
MSEKRIGTITHYFGKIRVAVIEIESGSLSVGDTIHVKGHTSDFTQHVDSMQIDNATVDSISVGQAAGLRVAEHARKHDDVYKVLPD